ncbi:MAG TPA: pantoate--beta-alanine ligase [Hyphomicrobiaceae bacterium]|nr:pantoate--beta-alanine ligase [Hyphomicrobiaceae bacterium]
MASKGSSGAGASAAGTSATVQVARTVSELRGIVAGWRRAGETLGLVPTMGALHEGHSALVRAAKSRCSRAVVSIFVNPTQFAPNEDFDKYPRTFDDDLAKVAAAGGDLVWAPVVKEMYRDGAATRVVPKGAALGLETDFRPHFFEGVATVCCKLFTQVGPDIALFGEKDYQQLAVVTQMVRDLDLPLQIVGHPTIREPDGLAMSSRNRYLSSDERARAVTIHKVINDVAGAARSGDPAAAISAGEARLTAAGFGKIDYVAVRDAVTFGAYDRASGRPGRVLAAAWLGKTRLIDNVAV